MGVQATTTLLSPVQPPSTLEATVARLGGAIRLGVLPAESRLPAERELAEQLAISRTTLRQAIEVLHQSGHLRSRRGRGGGTFVVARPPLTESGPRPLPDDWQDTVRLRRAVEVGVVCLAAERGRAEPAALAGHLRAMGEHVATMDAALEDFPVYRRADVGFHLALAEATAVRELVLASTRVQDAAGDLIAHISHPPAVLAHANEEHRRIRAAVAAGDRAGAIEVLCAHLEGTDLVLRGLAAGLPEDD